METIAQVVRDMPGFSHDPNLLVGTDRFSDAGVYRLAPDLAMVQSLDFFPPVVNDPESFGRIAVANALSDLYAMGAMPRTSLNIVLFPDNQAPLSILNAILRGAAEQVLAAGAVVLGGHSVRDASILFGASVTGTIHPDHVMTNEAAAPGDELVLTKAIGTGYITTAMKREQCEDEHAEAAIASMTRLNDDAARLARELDARSATDITGFGLAGHALEMSMASAVTIELRRDALPLLPGALEYAEGGFRSRANVSNRGYVARAIGSPDMLNEPGHADRWDPFFDPQTSGGLLVALAPECARMYLSQCREVGLDAAIIGTVQDKTPYPLVFS